MLKRPFLLKKIDLSVCLARCCVMPSNDSRRRNGSNFCKKALRSRKTAKKVRNENGFMMLCRAVFQKSNKKKLKKVCSFEKRSYLCTRFRNDECDSENESSLTDEVKRRGSRKEDREKVLNFFCGIWWFRKKVVPLQSFSPKRVEREIYRQRANLSL